MRNYSLATIKAVVALTDQDFESGGRLLAIYFAILRFLIADFFSKEGKAI